MHRIDTPSNTASCPTPLTPGTPGYFKAPDPGQHNGTEVSNDWLNTVQEEIAAVVEGLGGTLNKALRNQMWLALLNRVQGIYSAAADTQVVTTPHDRAVIAAIDSRVKYAASLVLGGYRNVVGSIGSVILGGTDNATDAMHSVIAGGVNNILSLLAARSLVLGGKNVKVATPDTIGFGAGATAPTGDATNQALGVRIDAATGGIHIKGKTYFGGNPNGSDGVAFDGDGATGSVDPVAGAVQFVGSVKVGGNPATGAGYTADLGGPRGELTAQRVTLGSGENTSSRTIAGGTPAAAGSPGDEVIIIEYNTMIAEASHVDWEIVNAGGANSFPVKGWIDISAGQVIFHIKNLGAGAVTTSEIRYSILNPA